MNEITLQNAVYAGSKNMSLRDIPAARATGFNAAADDYMERGIDLNEQLIANKPATFFFRMNSDAMTGAGIKTGDVLIVDKSLPAASGKVIIAAVDGELIVRRLQKNRNGITLLTENTSYAATIVDEFGLYSVWGVVTYVIHTV